jgi:hypothetical protein
LEEGEDVRETFKVFTIFAAEGGTMTAANALKEIRVAKLHGYKFLDRGWFNRIWTVQEAILGHKVVLRCGRLSLDLDVFREAASWLASPRHRAAVVSEWSHRLMTASTIEVRYSG